MQKTNVHLNPFIEKISYITRAYELCSAEPCKTLNLSQTELDIIAFLANNPGSDTAGDIATYRYISKASISLTVDSLIQKKLLTAIPDSDDRRRIHLTLTKKAAAMVTIINDSREKLREVLFEGFTPQEKESFLKGVFLIAENAHQFINQKNSEE